MVIKPLGRAVRRFGWIGLTLVFFATFLLLERYVCVVRFCAGAGGLCSINDFHRKHAVESLGKKKPVLSRGSKQTQPDSLLGTRDNTGFSKRLRRACDENH